MRLYSMIGLSLVACALACDSESEPGVSASEPSVTKTIGVAGGTIDVGGATVTFPAGAVDADKSITIAITNESAPDGYEALSKVVKCEPSGLDFAVPVTMALPFTADGKAATVFWSSGADPSFK